MVQQSFCQQSWYDYNLLIGGYNIGQDRYKLKGGPSFTNAENMPALYHIRTHNNAFLLAEMDFAAGWDQQTNFSLSSVDSIYSNNFQLFNVLLAFYINRLGDTKNEDKKVALGWFFSIDATLRQAQTDLDNSSSIIASPAGIGFGIGGSVMARFGDRLVTNHNLGISAIGNAQNDPNWIGRNLFYLGSASYPLSSRFALHAYLNLENIHFINHQKHSVDYEGDLFHWSLRFGIGIHIGKERMID